MEIKKYLLKSLDFLREFFTIDEKKRETAVKPLKQKEETETIPEVITQKEETETIPEVITQKEETDIKDKIDNKSIGKNVYSLGVDFSTQSAKIVILDVNKKEAVYTAKIEYDMIFPEYKTKGGILDSHIPEIKHTSPFMLIEVLEYMFEKIKNDGINLSEIYAVKIDAMQHCTVYTNKLFKEKIAHLDTDMDLIHQLRESISRKRSPIWEDRSPVDEVKTLTEMLESKGGISKLTGNKAELRFPGPQIMKWAKESPEEYNCTENIFLLSAFYTSILAGKTAPVDTGDGWGTNLNNLNIYFPGWKKEALSAVDTYLNKYSLNTPLQDKIGKMTHYDTVLGKINPYFVKKYGINSNAKILVGTGDNPATLLGCGGNIVISLGSSYTVNGIMKKILPSLKGEYNIFGYTKGKAMSLCCITNGAKVHDHFVKKYIIGSSEGVINKMHWQEYDKKTGESQLSKDEKLMLPYLSDESVPLCKHGIIREGFGKDDAQSNIRALHIAQCLALKLHSFHLDKINNICIVGGSSKSPVLRQILTDVFNAPSYSIKNSDFAAPIGCAIAGAKAILKISYQKAAEMFVRKDESTKLQPNKNNLPIIKHLLERYAAFEEKHLQNIKSNT